MAHDLSRQRTELPFRRDEWELLVTLPGQVVVAATSAEADRSRLTVAEGLAGIDAVAAGRLSASRLVREVVSAIYAEPDDDRPVAEEFRDRAAGIAQVVASCRVAVAVLNQRTNRVDAQAYRDWLEAIATRVCRAARSGGVLGVGGVRVSPAEQTFLDELSEALRDH